MENQNNTQKNQSTESFEDFSKREDFKISLIEKELEKRNFVLLIKKYKEMQGSDGYIMDAIVSLNGKECIHFFDGGYGGEAEIEYIQNKKFSREEKEFLDNLKLNDGNLNAVFKIKELIYNEICWIGSFIPELIENYLLEKKIIKDSKKGLLVRKNGDKENEYWIYKIADKEKLNNKEYLKDYIIKIMEKEKLEEVKVFNLNNKFETFKKINM
jgi:hypothetical protein